ncbi:helix-turn-helix domain-containing protein [Paraburkholderia bannensis]|uniref:helix-turn-helix domain-containing protein n=1 Tax=Paraburkholderia bannensis TaxID=765414 RepID=UPI002AB7C969|nr:helix-turn-helix domain-containing protein [Paraburkholderia bannensis]
MSARFDYSHNEYPPHAFVPSVNSTAAPSGVLKWTTSDVTKLNRFDWYSDFVSNAITPMILSSDCASEFESNIEFARTVDLSIFRQDGTRHRVRRDPHADDRSGEDSLHLIINLCSASNVTHREYSRLLPGEAIIVDSRLNFELNFPERYEVVHLKFSSDWLERWVPSAGRLVGQRIGTAKGWGRALSAFATQLSPQLFVSAPVASSVLSDQLGGLLALTASEISPRPVTKTEQALFVTIRNCIAERCCEHNLTASNVAKSLNISVRTLHRTLAANNSSYGALTMRLRLAVALRMLTSSLFHRVTTAEIGRRAGFADPSHFSKAFLRHFGRSPSQVRKGS